MANPKDDTAFFQSTSISTTEERSKKKAMKMGSNSTPPFKDQPLSLTKKLLPCVIYSLLPIALLLRLYCSPLPFLLSAPTELPHPSPITITPNSSLPSCSPTSSAGKKKNFEAPCDYFSGKWIRDRKGPLYNGTTCGTIKEGQNCISHGRPDKGYLYWRWKPSECNLPRFEPKTFLQLLENKHLAFVGDSLARNQLESLLCMLVSASTPNIIYRNGEDNKFRQWHFPSHNVSISVYWSPFLVEGIEKSNNGSNHNKVFLDQIDEKWAKDLDQMDMIVLTIGHWYLLPAVYFEGGSVLGCHYCPDLNHTEIGFYDMLRKAFKTTLNSIIERRGGKMRGIDIILTTFPPAHFEGEWDKAGSCPKTKPYGNGEKELEGMDAEMRKIGIQQVEAAKTNAIAKEFGGLRLEALDISKLALLRPDGHPGPYMNPFPFSNGVQEHVQNDCVHWCLPGPIDTWNEILLEKIKKWQDQFRSEE